MRTERVIIALAIVLLPGLLLGPVWRLAGLGANEDDVLYYYPSRVFLHETAAAGHWPWLNPWNGLDRPYAADPQSALWYPPTWLFIVLPPLWAYPLILWAHYSLATWGMYRLLRAAALGRRAALFGGVVFAFCGFMLAHRAHFTMQQAAAWAPWVFWRMQRYGLAAGSRGAGIRRLSTVAIVATLQCLAGHVQIAAITALGSLVFLLMSQRAHREGVGSGPVRLHAVVVRWLLVWICVAGLSAVQWLPTLAYVRACTRAERTYADFVENSWSPVSAIGWVLPMLFGQRTPNVFGQPYWGPSHQCEQFSYAGLIPLLLALLGSRVGWRSDPRRWAWLVVLVFGLLLALGEYGPLCRPLYLLPGSNLFRVPARALLLFNLATAALAALTLHDLGAAHTPRRARLRAVALRWTRRPVLTALVLVALPLLLIIVALPWLPGDTRSSALAALKPWNPAILVPLVIALLCLFGVGLAVRHWRQPRWLWLPAVIAMLDLGVIGWTIDVPPAARRPADLLVPPDQSWLEPLRDSQRRLWVVTDRDGVYTDPVRKRAANTNALIHVPALTDYGPLQPVPYDRQFAFTPWGISREPADLLNHTRWMRAFNVGWILVCDPQWPAPSGCDLVTTTTSGWRLYRNPAAAGMAFFEDPGQPGGVRYAERGPNAFVTHVDTWPARAAADQPVSSPPPADWPRLIVARLALRGWRATVNGDPVAIETAHDALLAVRVPAGQAVTINWSYSPPALAAGAVISILSALGMLIFVGLGSGRRPAHGARR